MVSAILRLKDCNEQLVLVRRFKKLHSSGRTARGLYRWAAFTYNNFTLPSVHGTEPSSQITMNVYGRYHTFRPTPCTVWRCPRPPLSQRRPFGICTQPHRRRCEMYTGLIGLVRTCRRSAVSTGRR